MSDSCQSITLTTTTTDIYQILKKYWSYDSFRPLQEEIITSILQGCDTLALLPTGGGKSLCYQIPALASEGLCLVVSPLIALMKDQVQNLHDKKIKAACIIAGTTGIEQEIIFNQCQQGKIKILYVSPERLKQQVFIQHLRHIKVAFIAVDEAHCISQWGHDFRPAYLDIANIRQYHPQAPIVALTATATPEVVHDIQEQLLFRAGNRLYKTSFKRENLAYMVLKEEDKIGRALRIIRHSGGCGIIYVRNRRLSRQVAEQLVAEGITATYYHAGLDAKERDMAQKRWMQNEVAVMVATNAFGMGIDKADVRFVIHLDIPDSIEAYFQEAGRAGRNGQRAYAVILYNQHDLDNLDAAFASKFPSRQQISNTYRAICNYYQIPIGTGTGSQYDFDIQAICNTYHFNVLVFYNASRFLEREGLIAIPDREEAESRLYIPLNKEELYRFQMDQPRYSDLITVISRMYGGLFTEYVPIHERQIARHMYMEEQQITNMLLHLDALKIVSYRVKKSKPQIHFTSERIPADHLYLHDENYKTLKECASRRKEAMRQYVVATKGCRSEMLLAYFHERATTPCQLCDLCIAENKNAQQHTTDLRQQIIAILKEQPLMVNEICERINDMDEEQIRTVLRQLVDERIVSINQRLQFCI